MKIPIEKYASWIILFSALIVYVATQSQSLDDWDSVQFAMGIEHYDIRLHHPHPPGYPLYIFIGKFLNLFIHNPRKALTLLSAISGAITIWIFYHILRRYHSFKLSISASALLLVTPVFWLTSIKALTDIPATLAIYLTVYCGLRYINTTEEKSSGSEGSKKSFKNISPWWLYLAGIGTALGIGLRPQNASALVPCFLTTIIWRFNFKHFLVALIILVIFISAWFIPMIIINGGLETYLELNRQQFNYRLDKSNPFSVLADPYSPAHYYKRARTHCRVFFSLGMGFGTKKFYHISITLITLIGWILFLIKGGVKSRIFRFNFPWIVCYLLMVYLTLPADARYYT
ncbi:DUF2723 domain-containing protein, partial [Candidatus Sumerlaeota bacterium]|nr:DUF2723 domain-containing protein [Candidatus Sumerlaeota bacterium]